MTTDTMMRALRFHHFGPPAEVLHLEQSPVPEPMAGTVGVRVLACGLNPADWALCQGLFPGALPRGIGLDVVGVVTALGAGVTGVRPGDTVFGPADYTHYPSAGASDHAVLTHWSIVPPGLGVIEAAALPLVVETASRYLGVLKPQAGQTIVIHGAGTMVGYAAVQIALLSGATVVATAGETFAAPLRAMGALVTTYGQGMVERIQALLPHAPDHVLDVAPVNLVPGAASALPDLVTVAGGDPQRVVTVADWENAAKFGVRTGMEDLAPLTEAVMHWDRLAHYADLAAAGRFSIPVAGVYPLENWREALRLSLGGKARGKLVLAIAPDLKQEA